MSASVKAPAPTSTGEQPSTAQKLKGLKRQVLTEGQLAAAEVTREAKARRDGKQADPIVLDDVLEEDWHLDAMSSTPKADANLAGLYRVKHGNLCIQAMGRPGAKEDKEGRWRMPNGDTTLVIRGPRVVDGVQMPGRKIRLTADEARIFLEQDLVERLD